jgi:hypothetical protein
VTGYVLQLVADEQFAKKHCIDHHCISLSPAGREGRVSGFLHRSIREEEFRQHDHRNVDLEVDNVGRAIQICRAVIRTRIFRPAFLILLLQSAL